MAWPFLRIALLNHHRRRRADPDILRQVADQWSSSGSCGRIFDNALGGIEETRMSRSSWINRMEAKQIAALPITRAMLLEETMRVWLSTLNRFTVAYWHEQMRGPRVKNLRGT